MVDTVTEEAILKLPKDQQEKIRKALARQATKRTSEDELRAKYPSIVEGSLEFDEGVRKQSVEIQCTHEGCDATRRVFTSDLFQVKVRLEHKTEQRKEARAAFKALVAEVKAKAQK